MARRRIIAGNWKMNKTPSEAVELCATLKDLVVNDAVDVVYCVPAIDIVPVAEAVKGTNVHVGAENFYIEDKGAFTGEISADMLTELGVEYVVIGHSERRQYFGETDETVNKRTIAALEAGLKPIVCVGELKWERECNITEEVIARQIKLDLWSLTAEQVKNVVIAYEPVWAIGTGLTATSDQAEEIHAYIRSLIAEKYGNEIADNTTILYGGSCKASNAKELFSKPDVDGGLIGGASLKAPDFKGIIDAF